MSDENQKRSYHNFNPANGYPAGSNLYYECLRCGEVVPSRPSDSTHCQCRNIMIDVDYGRVKIQDHNQVKLFSTMN
jgi:hypothetical protein